LGSPEATGEGTIQEAFEQKRDSRIWNYQSKVLIYLSYESLLMGTVSCF
jgi:hypothetical protein